MKKYLYISLIVITGLFASCKKNNDITTNNNTDTTKSASTLDLVKDSVYLYAKEDYLWYDALPSYTVFNPRSFTGSSDIDALQKEVDAISQYKINLATNLPYEYNASYPGESKYSFIDNGQTSQILQGNNGDFGFFPVYYTSYTDLRVRYVNAGSPAAIAGMHRGDLITAINNSTNLDGSITANINAINNALQANTIALTLKRNNGTTYSVNLSTATYTLNPVMKDTIYNGTNGKKIGYLVFSTFTTLTNAKAPLDAAFNYFVNNGVTDLVVDLRYNGGGAVETAEYLDNLIVPAAKTGTTMYTYYFNDKLQNDNYPLLSKVFSISPGDFKAANNIQSFSKKGSLNINNVTFIVTGRTASASELTINNLLPEMNVKLLGSITYGKPVGFFPIPINKYNLYVPEFETKNSANQGGYYNGMTPGSATYPGLSAADDVSKDFGDPNEGLLAHALSYTNTGTFAIPAKQVASTSGLTMLSTEQQKALNSKFDSHLFTGMVFNKKMHRK